MSGKRMKGSGTDRYTAVGAHRGGDAGLGRHVPYTAPGSRIPSRPTLTPQSSPRSDIKKKVTTAAQSSLILLKH